ncbi:amidohydrolase family protein [Marinovum sp. 2_MG-2023]|uniref:amidohydrolase family protein n=1 Tax=unclassified Marinovum TaxID=2647166 RepID=UPI0026E41639|nr:MULTISPECIES: amidohydrolase family protein [unclassified Marinovum]MDO6731168.1 amidohydrolase family protein [Marinovum sp. 2_MG-2023]MDO6778665.1 amidohydrolase family protein [Marinovum sp. 1_MG-2023]
MKIIDPHFHLWDLARHAYPWLSTGPSTGVFGDNTAIRKTYLLPDFIAETKDFTVEKTVHVEAAITDRQSVQETAWLQDIAGNPFSKGLPNGIVGFCDLSATDAHDVLDAHCTFRNMRGIRQILNTSDDARLRFTETDYMALDSWNAGFAGLAPRRLSFDLQIYPHQMADAAALAQRFPETQIVLNHTGMPHDHSAAGFADWSRGMEALAGCANVVVKISGLGMMVHDWTVDAIRPYVTETIDIFGAHRCMFASNFPVDGMYSSFDTLWSAYRDIVAGRPAAEQDALFRTTAERVYRI